MSICLFKYTDDGKLIFCQDAAEQFFKSVYDDPIAIVSCVGPYRQGKSFVLNQILLKENSFRVSSESNACTRGIWISQTILKHNGKKIFVMDSEGVKSTNANNNTDNIIFCLCIVLSSFLIYNTKACIDSGALEDLHTALDSSRLLTSTDSKTNIFPSFMWLLRDVGLKLVDESIPDREISPNDYLEQKLTIHGDDDPRARLKKTISSCFRDRQCFTMSYPKVENISKLSEMSHDQLPAQFKNEMCTLRSKVLDTVPLKTIDNKQITGRMFLNLCLEYTDAINNNSIPTPQSSLSKICEAYLYTISDEVSQWYSRELSGLPLTNPDEFEDKLKHIKNTAKQIFLKKTQQLDINDDDVYEFCTKKLDHDVRDLKHKNRTQFFEKLALESRDIKKQFVNHPSVSDFKTAIKRLFEKINESKQVYVNEQNKTLTKFAIDGVLSVDLNVILQLHSRTNDSEKFETLKQKHIQLELENSQQLEVNTRLHADLKTSQNQNKDLENTTMDMVEKMKECELAKESLQAKLKQQAETINKIKNDLTEARELNSAHSENEMLLNLTVDKYKKLQTENKKTQELNIQLEMDHKFYKKRIEGEFEAEKDDLTREKDNLICILEQMKQKIQENQSDVEDVSRLQNKLAENELENKRLGIELENTTSQLKQVRKKSLQYQHELDELKTNSVPTEEFDSLQREFKKLTYVSKLEFEEKQLLKEQIRKLKMSTNELKRKSEYESFLSCTRYKKN